MSLSNFNKWSDDPVKRKKQMRTVRNIILFMWGGFALFIAAAFVIPPGEKDYDHAYPVPVEDRPREYTAVDRLRDQKVALRDKRRPQVEEKARVYCYDKMHTDRHSCLNRIMKAYDRGTELGDK